MPVWWLRVAQGYQWLRSLWDSDISCTHTQLWLLSHLESFERGAEKVGHIGGYPRLLSLNHDFARWPVSVWRWLSVLVASRKVASLYWCWKALHLLSLQLLLWRSRRGTIRHPFSGYLCPQAIFWTTSFQLFLIFCSVQMLHLLLSCPCHSSLKPWTPLLLDQLSHHY